MSDSQDSKLPKPYYERDGITIYCGDCRDILPLLGPVDLVLTDPPSGISYRHGSRKGGLLLGFDEATITGDDMPFDPSLLVDHQRVVMWGANHYADRLSASKGWLVWDKRVGIPPNDQSDCEMAWTNFLTRAHLFSRYWNGGGINEERWHPSQKPIALMRWCIELAGDGIETILDPFMGSGTTLRAAKDLGRRAVGIEIEEKYVEIAIKRLAQEVMPL